LGIRVEFDNAGTETALSLETRRAVYLVFKEALNNAVKYAGATQIEIAVRTVGKRLAISVNDNGRGFAVEQATGGNGLQNMHRRAADVGGTLSVISKIGKGTHVHLRL
jgi:signal transduction histidine kinase